MEREEERRGDGAMGRRTVGRREGERWRKGEEEENVKKNAKKQKCGSGVLPGSFVNTLQTVFVVELLPESAELSLHDFHTVCVCLCMCTSACAIFIYRLCLWRIVK